jgi:cation transport ATPase
VGRMHDDKQEEKSIDEILKEEFEKELNQIIEENPDFSEEEISFLKSKAESMLQRKLNQTKKGYLFKRTLLSIITSFLSGLCILGFFFPTIVISPKWMIIVVISIVSLVMSIIDSLVLFIKNKFRLRGLNLMVIISPVLCAISSYFVNSYVILIFKYHYIFSIIIVLIFVLKIIINNYLFKYIPRLRRSL